MQKIDIENKIQEIVNEHFDKILKIDIGNNEYNIAIRKEQIPKIEFLELEKDHFCIMFEKNMKYGEINLDYNIITDNNNKIEGVVIGNVNKLKSDNYVNKINKYMTSLIDDIPMTNTKEIVLKHKQKRLIYAISEILKTVPNMRYSQQVDD